jgi:hypothetical protein
VREVRKYGSEKLKKLSDKEIATLFVYNLIDRYFSTSYLDLEDLELID